MMEINDRKERSKLRLIVTICSIGAVTLVLVGIGIGGVLGSNAADEPTIPTERITAVTEAAKPSPTQAANSTAADNGGQTQVPQTASAPPQTQAQTQRSTTGSSGSAGGVISPERAKRIALQDAGLSESSVTMSRVKLEWDDGIQVYDVEFYRGGMEYEYTIDAISGAIYEKEIDD